MQHIIVSALIFGIASSWLFGIGYSQRTFDVLQYGAVGDGQADDSQAFANAWRDLCGAAEANDLPTLVIPEGRNFLLQPIKFEGPCTSNSVHVQLLGNVVAPRMPGAWKECGSDWLQFSGVNNLILDGSGEINGQGSGWWSNNANKYDMSSFGFQENKKQCSPPDKALKFHQCNNLRLSGLAHRDSARAHIGINGCNNVQISHLTITAPEDSPNTDGIDISASTLVQISDSIIGTGDDCIAINGGCSDLMIANVACGPGHGISVGSLGEHGTDDQVGNVYVKDCSFSKTTNGARIKTWQGGSGYVRNITFERITLDAAQNPIIIDQYYGNGDSDSKYQTSAVLVDNVRYIDFQGTSASEEAIKLQCNQISGCQNIVMDRIQITSNVPSKMIYASCKNAIGTSIGTVVPTVPCMKIGGGDPATPSSPLPYISPGGSGGAGMATPSSPLPYISSPMPYIFPGGTGGAGMATPYSPLPYIFPGGSGGGGMDYTGSATRLHTSTPKKKIKYCICSVLIMYLLQTIIG